MSRVPTAVIVADIRAATAALVARLAVAEAERARLEAERARAAQS